MRTRSTLIGLLFFLLSFLFFARPARAQPWFGAADGALEERFADGDIDEEDLARIPALERRGERGAARRANVTGAILARTWVSLVAFLNMVGGL